MSVVGLTDIAITVVQEEPELAEELLLPGDVRGEDEGADQVRELGELSLSQIFGQAGLHEAGDGRPPVVVLQHRDVVVEDRQVAPSRHQELLVHAGMVEVVTHRRGERGQQLQVGEVGPKGRLLAEHVDRLGHVGRVYGGVVGVAAVVASLHHSEESGQIGRVHCKTGYQS